MRNLGIKVGFNIFVTYYYRHERPNRIEMDVFQDIYIMNDFICSGNKTVMSIYFGICEQDGSIIRGISVPTNVRYMDFYKYKELLHLEYSNEQGKEQISV